MLDKLGATLANTSDTLGNVKEEVLNNSLAESPPDEKAETLGDTLGYVKALVLVDTA